MSHIPPLEYRGRPRPFLLHVGEVLTGIGGFQFLLWVLDQFGRGESAMEIYARLPVFLRFIRNPLFPGVVLIVGFALLWMQGKNFEPPAPKTELVHPTTFQPIRFRRRARPALKRALWASACALLAALPVWALYKTPLQNFAFVQPLPENFVTAPPPVVVPIVPEENRLKRRGNPMTPPVKMPIAPVKPAVAPPQVVPSSPTQALNRSGRPPIPEPIPASAPLTCPAPGALAQGWTIWLQQMMGGTSGPPLPIENGPINFQVDGPNDSQSRFILHPLLVGKVRMLSSPLRGSQIQAAETLLEDLKSQVGSPAALPYKSAEKPQRFVSRFERQFQNSQTLAVQYVDGMMGNSDAIQSGEASVAIASLAPANQEFILKLDDKAKTDADRTCEGALKNLTQDE